MQHARFYFGLIALSMVLPSSPLKAGSFDKFPQQHVSNSLDTSKNQRNAADQAFDASQDASKNSEHKNEQPTGSDRKTETSLPSVIVEAPKPYTAAELFAARNTTAKKEELILQTQKEEALSAKQFNSLLKACMSHGKTKEECLFEAYNEAVKLQENAGSFIIAQEILAEKNASELEKEKAKLKKAQDTQKRFYLKVAGGVVLVAAMVFGLGGYKLGSHVKAEPALTEAGIAAAVTTALGTRILTSEQTQAAAFAGVQPLLQALAVSLNAEQTQQAVTVALAPVLQAIQALPQAAAAD